MLDSSGTTCGVELQCFPYAMHVQHICVDQRMADGIPSADSSAWSLHILAQSQHEGQAWLYSLDNDVLDVAAHPMVKHLV